MKQEKIEIKPISLSEQKPIEIHDCYLILASDYARIRMAFLAKEPIIDGDPDSGWEQRTTDWDLKVSKSCISGVERITTRDGKYKVSIICRGLGEDIKMYFDRKLESENMFNRVNDWLFGKEEDKT